MKIFKKRTWKKKTVIKGGNYVERGTTSKKYDRILEYRHIIQIEHNDSDSQVKEAEHEYLFLKNNKKDVVLVNLKNNIVKRYIDEKLSIVKITLLSSIEEDLQNAISHLLSDESKDYYLKNDYDFAWIKLAIDSGFFNGFDRIISSSFQSFCKLMCGLGFEGRTPDRSVINKYYHRADTSIFPWRYVDCDSKERMRRNSIVKEFTTYMGQIRGYKNSVHNFMHT